MRVGLLLAACVVFLGGCEGACTTLAERTCARVGEGDALCVKLRAVAQSPRAADLQACDTSNAFIDELEKR